MNTSTGLCAVILCTDPLTGEGLDEISIKKIQLVLTESPEIINISRLDEKKRWDKTELLRSIEALISRLEQKEGDVCTYVLFAFPALPELTTIHVMESFQRILVDGLSYGLEAEKKINGIPYYAIWRRESLRDLAESKTELKIIPYFENAI